LQIGNNGFSFDPINASLSLESGAADSGCTFDTRGRDSVCGFSNPLSTVTMQKADLARSPFSPAPLPLAECASSAAPIYRFGAGYANLSRAVNVGAAGSAIVPDSWKQPRGCVLYRGNAFSTNYLENAFI